MSTRNKRSASYPDLIEIPAKQSKNTYTPYTRRYTRRSDLRGIKVDQFDYLFELEDGCVCMTGKFTVIYDIDTRISDLDKLYIPASIYNIINVGGSCPQLLCVINNKNKTIMVGFRL